ncbi:MAG: TetR/AcrR family transcriptional regulator [Verrucomicrobia bacterium]|nr:TetR/AcrR family transcriptional regulator [Verrucomicrobiota bacterium]
MPPKKLIDDAFVLEKALLVISELGPETFTLADVGKSVGLAPATLMQRFGSKQALLIKAAKQVPATLKMNLEKLKARALAWDAELMALLSELPEGFGTRQDIANSLGLLKLDMIDPELHPIARELFDTMRSRVKELLEKGKAQEMLAQQCNVDSLAWELDALRHGLVIQWTLSGEGPLQQWLHKGLQTYLEGKRDEISVLS